MIFRLKDRELQKKLDEISDGSFSSRLADVSGEIPNLFRQSISTRIYFGDKYQFYLHATQDMLEEAPEYDPHGWNDFPEVEPPEGVLMRCEWIDVCCNASLRTASMVVSIPPANCVNRMHESPAI